LAKFLALDFDGDQFAVVSATIKAGRLQIQRALAWDEKQTLTPATAKALGHSLRDHLKAERVGPAPVLACVPRDRLILKEVSYPPVPASDEPAVIRFQVLRELTTNPATVVIDYLPDHNPSPLGERHALVIILPKELLAAYRELCAAAGLSLAGLVPRPFATAECLNQQMTSETNGSHLAGSAVAVLTLAERWAEFCLVKDRGLVLARTMAAPAAGQDAALIGEIRRNLAVYAGQAGHSPVQSLYVAEGGRQTAFADRLATTLAIPVYRLDPFGGLADSRLPTERRGLFAAAVGALQARAYFRTLPINFVRPKEPKPPRDPNRWKALVAAASILILVLGTAIGGYSMISDRDRELKALNLVKVGLDGQLQQLQEDERHILAVNEWTKERIIWLDELYDLTDRFPDPNSVRLIHLAADPLTHTAKDDHVARITLEGIATDDPKELDSFLAHLRADGHYGVDPKVVGPNLLRVDRFRFSRQFKSALTVKNREPNEYQLILSAEPPVRKRDLQNAGQGAGFDAMGGGELP
jgi:hypothetical protein